MPWPGLAGPLSGSLNLPLRSPSRANCWFAPPFVRPGSSLFFLFFFHLFFFFYFQTRQTNPLFFHVNGRLRLRRSRGWKKKITYCLSERMQPCMFIPPPTRLVIRKYAVHVRSGVITGSAVVLRVHCALYRRCFCFFWLCFNVAAREKKKKKKQSRADSSSSSHQAGVKRRSGGSCLFI